VLGPDGKEVKLRDITLKRKWVMKADSIQGMTA
jgi:hypothetical protein